MSRFEDPGKTGPGANIVFIASGLGL
jgi:hypothetical protein